jgi:16S rRNA (adenine1518-N6/adenine1519-N6)-dimethyltransferase
MTAVDDLPPLRETIRRHGLSAKKSLGQNFLLDLNLTARIARAGGPIDGISVVEIGPGPGGLTRALIAQGARQVIAIERDRRAIAALGEIAAHYPGRLTVIEGDALEIDWHRVPALSLAEGQSRVAAAFTSPRLPSGRLRPSSTGYGEVDRAERGRVRGPLRESEPAERPPHPDPLHSPSKTGVNALKASGEREQLATRAARSQLLLEGGGEWENATRIVANLPYNIATALLVRWLAVEPWPPWYDSLVLMFQREVAERIVASPGTKQYGRLAVLAGWRADARIMFDVAPSAFVPPPKVTSSVVRLVPRAAPLPCARAALERVTAAAFAQRRKMLRQSLRALGHDPQPMLATAGIDPTARAEDVAVEGFVALANAFDATVQAAQGNIP